MKDKLINFKKEIDEIKLTAQKKGLRVISDNLNNVNKEIDALIFEVTEFEKSKNINE